MNCQHTSLSSSSLCNSSWQTRLRLSNLRFAERHGSVKKEDLHVCPLLNLAVFMKNCAHPKF